ncbi:MAG TPA: flippase activity-associated protein Agl23 [Pyrinomonadaceae bacterium]|nr:flippase activity-associated protein Agl23 [Pyrinomonadaceae bacterium]
MSTRSTKQGSKKVTGKNPGAQSKYSRSEPEVSVATEPDLPESVWRIGVIAIFLIAAVLRLYNLNLVPLHHDEGVNGNFLVRLVREGAYNYDPANYHGPTLYYFSAIIPWITKLFFGNAARDNYGLTTFTIRLVPVVFGLATIVLIFLLRRRLGTIATLAAGLMLAVSPGAVYLSRYFIHETLFVFFTLGIVVAVVRAYDARNPAYLIAAAASAALLFATKETAMISAGVLVIALVMTWAYLWLVRAAGVTSSPKRNREPNGPIAIIDRMGGMPRVYANLGVALIVFVALYVLFYTSFFTNNKGFTDSLQTFAIWAKTGSEAHKHPATTYFVWLLSQESPLLFVGALGAAITVLRPKNPFALFCALWSFGLIAAYSLIAYKTPWLMLNFIVPLAMIAGYAIQAIYDMLSHLTETALVSWSLPAMILVAALCVAGYQTIDLNFFNYDNDKEYYVYVYAHTTRSTLALVDEIDRLAKENSGNSTGITIVSPDYWPLPWYFRNYTRVGYYGRFAATTEPLIIANANQKDEVDASYGQYYEQVNGPSPGGTFQLRPGVDLLLYQRRKQ